MNSTSTTPFLRPGVVFILACSVSLTFILIGFRLLRTQPPGDPEQRSPEVASASTPTDGLAPASLPSESNPTAATSLLEEQLGVRVAGLKLTLDTAAVELSYKVVTPQKAGALATGATEIYLVDQFSGTKLALLTSAQQDKLPPRSRARLARQGGNFPPSHGRLAADKINSLVFPNQEKVLHFGSKVSVVMGGYHADDMTVQ